MRVPCARSREDLKKTREKADAELHAERAKKAALEERLKGQEQARTRSFNSISTCHTRAPPRPQDRTSKLQQIVQDVSRGLEDDKRREVEQVVEKMELEVEDAKKQAEKAARALAAKEVASLQAQLAEAKEESDRQETYSTKLAINLRPMKDAVNYVDHTLLASKENRGFLSELEAAHDGRLQKAANATGWRGPTEALDTPREALDTSDMHRPRTRFAPRHMVKELGQIDLGVLGELGLRDDDIVNEGSAWVQVCSPVHCHHKCHK